MDRTKKIVKISILGIIVNIILVFFKSMIGIIANSIAIILDAVNNLSDVLASLITVVGTKLSSKRPDKEHPFGHGRIEYFSSIIISFLILVAGLAAFNESLAKIIHPVRADYSIVSLLIIIITVFVKFILGKYVKNQGEKLNSDNLIASGIDAISDSLISLSTFIAGLISFIWQISIEGYIGIIISIFIIKSSFEILKKTVDDIIGVRANSKITNKLKTKIQSYDEVLGVYDLILHSYGPNKIIATANIQVNDKMNAKTIHKITRKIIIDVYNSLGIFLTLGIYASNDDKKYKDLKKYLDATIKEYKSIIQLHGFYVDDQTKDVSFDLIFNFEELESEKIVKKIIEKMKEKFPKYNYSVIIDNDFSD